MLPLSSTAVAILMVVAAIGLCLFVGTPVMYMWFTPIVLGAFIIIIRDNQND